MTQHVRAHTCSLPPSRISAASFFLTVASLSGSKRDVRLDLLAGGVDVLRQAGDLEDGLLVPRGRHYVGVRLLLDALDGRALRTHDQANNTVGNAYLRGKDSL